MKPTTTRVAVLRWADRLRHLPYASTTILTAFVLLLDGTGVAMAQSAKTAGEGWANRFFVRGRIAGVLPRDKAHYNVPVETHVSNSVIPNFDLSYFFTDNIAVESICCVTRNEVSIANGGPTIGEAWLIPLDASIQYHFHLGNGVKPYLGAGPTVVITASDSAKGPATSFKLRRFNPGFLIQAGVDIELKNNWYFNADIKKFFADVKADVVAGGVVSGKASIDPVVAGIGFGYRF
ncbi:outer membrane protein [Roseovarius sp. MBR-154]